MCLSKADGGKRCAAHTRPGYLRARSALVATGEVVEQMPVAARDELIEKYIRAVEAFAATPTGREELRARLRDLEAGAPATGDLREVIAHAVRPVTSDKTDKTDRAAADRALARQEQREDLASLLASKNVAASTAASSGSTASEAAGKAASKAKGRALSPEGHHLQKMMQTGALVTAEEIAARMREAAPEAPVALGAVKVRGEQAHLIRGGSTKDTVTVTAAHTKQDDEGRSHGVLLVDHAGAGVVQWAAVRDPGTGVWTVTGRA